ncbi:hypothetical protein [uncultured Campylobacter sp.]|uniref:hypothetical protein n=1 Tax=uncultured Campylobacter sp. TaxID=218934 RepID=UPI0026103849|nr:hypothetical protein [uncultured Campylobacter sp.]
MNLVMLGILIAICIFKLIRSKQQIRFTDRYIEFIENGVVKRFCKVEFDELRRSFSIDVFISSEILQYICNLSLTIMGFIALKWELLEIIFFIYLWGFFLNFIFYLSVNKNLKGFRALPFIRVAEYTTPTQDITIFYQDTILFTSTMIKFTTISKSIFCRKI